MTTAMEKFRRTARDKRADDYFRLVDAYLEAKAGEPDQWGDYHLPTPVGTLRLNPDHRKTYEHQESDVVTVFAKFDDVDSAKLVMRSWEWNDHSGKWNHHLGLQPGIKTTVADTFGGFRDDIEAILQHRFVPTLRRARAVILDFQDAYHGAVVADDWAEQFAVCGFATAIAPDGKERIKVVRVDRPW